MSRPKGARSVLIKVDYGTIAEFAGITPDMAKRLARQGLFDSRDLESVLRWINGRRQRQGEPLIGLPTDDASQAHSDDTAADTPVETGSLPEDIRVRVPAEGHGSLVYDPTTGTFRDDDHGG